MTQQNQIEVFLQKIQPFIDHWRSIDLRTMCIKKENRWINVFTRILLRTEELKKCRVEKGLPSFDNLRTIHKVMDIDRLNEIISSIAKGKLKLDDVTVEFIEIKDKKEEYYHFNIEERSKERSQSYPVRIDKKTICLHGTLGDLYKLITHEERKVLNTRLMTLDPPYVGLDDVTKNIFLMGDIFDHISSMQIIVIAPIYISFGGISELRENEMNVNIIGYGNIELKDIKLNVISETSSREILRKSFDLNEKDIVSSDGHLHLKKSVDLDESTLAHLMLIYREKPIDKLKTPIPRIGTSNPRLKTHELFDNELHKLFDFLHPGKPMGSKQDKFEIGVAWLLHACGFSVAHYGLLRGGRNEEIDVIAFVPNSYKVLAAECTILDIDKNDKLTKLSRRAKDLKETLEEYEILPAIFTALDEDRISTTHLEAARKEGIAVITSNKIQLLYDMAVENTTASTVYEFIRGLDPYSVW